MAKFTMEIANSVDAESKEFDVPNPMYAYIMITLAVDSPLAPLMGLTETYMDDFFTRWFADALSGEDFSVTMERFDFFGNKYTDVYTYSA